MVLEIRNEASCILPVRCRRIDAAGGDAAPVLQPAQDCGAR